MEREASAEVDITAGAIEDCDDSGRLGRLNVAERQFQQGLQAIKDDRLEDAVSLLCMCLETRVDIYGAAAPETASTYYRYGAALLYSVQDSADVFGGELTMAAQQHDNQVDVEPAAAVAEVPTPVSGPSSAPKAAGASNFNGKEEEEDDDAEDDETQPTSDAEAAPSDVQLAWENLETAKRIYAAQGASCAMELADVVMLLGDLSAEDDAFERALPDYMEALALLKSFPEGKPAPVQRLAEVHFKASLALQYLNRIPESMAETKDAITLCKQRLSVLRKADAAAKIAPEQASLPAAAATTDAAKGGSVAASGAKSPTADPGQVKSSSATDPGRAQSTSSTALGQVQGGVEVLAQAAAEAEAACLTDSLEGLQERIVELQDRLDEEKATRTQIKAAYTSAMAVVVSAADCKTAGAASTAFMSAAMPATTSAGMSATTSAATPALSANAAAPSTQPIQDLGVVGRGGKRRLTPVPVGTCTGPPLKKSNTTHTEPQPSRLHESTPNDDKS